MITEISRTILSKHLAKRLVEDGVPVNNAGGGHIASIGVGPEGEPPGIPPKKKRRKVGIRTELIRRWKGKI